MRQKSAAFMLLLLPALAAAKDNLTCVTKAAGRYTEPASLSALVECQQRQLEAATAAYQTKHHADPAAELVDSWQDRQRAAVSDYLNRHPNRASLETPSDAPADAKAAKGTDVNTPDAAKEGKGDAGSVDELGAKLRAESNGGKNGVTPDMANQVRDYLQKNQGSVSPDMQKLLDGVAKDGVKLTPETMGQLQNAAQQAKGQGLNLNTDKNTEELLLNSPNASPNSN